MKYLALVFSCLPFLLFSQNIDTQQLFNDKVEVYFSFEKSDAVDHTNIGSLISIDHKQDAEKAYAYANKKQFEAFITLGIPYTILKSPAEQANVKTGKSANSNWDYYPSYDEYIDMMYQYAADYPWICELKTIGTSVNGRELIALKITDNPESTEAEPKFLYTSSMHGDELTGYVLMLRLIDHLLSNYPTDDEVAELVENVEIWINPLANPDGAYAGGNNNINGATRSNAYGVDLNRNYPDPSTNDHPDGNEWQTETEAFLALADAEKFNISCNLHTGAEVCNYPWDTWSKLSADDDWWQHVCNEYAENAHEASSFSGYFSSFNNGITNGYAWYSVDGGRQDYMNYYHNCREFTLELTDNKIPNPQELPAFWDYNKQSLIDYLKQSLYGATGVVTDSLTGEPLMAQVDIVGHDEDNSHVYSALPHGNFHRYLYAGNYNLTFTADGYNSKTVNFNIQNNTATQINVQLSPALPISINNISTNKKLVQVFDVNGKPSKISPNTLLLYMYDDGSVEKRVIAR